jgi:hypothetical protein
MRLYSDNHYTHYTPTSSRTTQTQIHKGTVIHRQPPLLLDIPLPERFREMLDRHAGHQEPIKRHPARTRIVLALGRGIPLLQLADEVARQWVAETVERLFEFFAVDRAGSIAVELLEDVVPVLEGFG